MIYVVCVRECEGAEWSLSSVHMSYAAANAAADKAKACDVCIMTREAFASMHSRLI